MSSLCPPWPFSQLLVLVTLLPSVLAAWHPAGFVPVSPAVLPPLVTPSMPGLPRPWNVTQSRVSVPCGQGQGGTFLASWGGWVPPVGTGLDL